MFPNTAIIVAEYNSDSKLYTGHLEQSSNVYSQ
jgi:hypothetical protein